MWNAEKIIEGLEEAAETLKRLRQRGWNPAGRLTYWPDVIADSWSGYGRTPVKTRLGPPQADAISRMDQVLLWPNLIEDFEREPAREVRRLVWARANRISWRELEDCDGRSAPTLRKIWRAGIIDILCGLNKQA